MRITPIRYDNTLFGAKQNSKITKKFVTKSGSQIEASLSNHYIQFLNSVSNLKISDELVKKILKDYGITYLQVKDKAVNVASGYNGGFYTVNFDKNISPETLKIYFVQLLLKGDNSKLGGLFNYKSMVSDIKRQDIIQKGMKLHTYDLNNNVSEKQEKMAAECLSKLSKKFIRPKNLFFIEDEAHYYDDLEKIAYSINLKAETKSMMKPTFRVCRFEIDERGNAIGYTATAEDIYTLRKNDSVYREQQTASEILPEIAEASNNKRYAESFRFGNTKIYGAKIKQAIPNVIEHLSSRVKNPKQEQLQVVKFYDKNRNIESRICFYDSSTGRSIVYDNSGNYLYQMEYIKNANGEIISCVRC